MHQNEKSKTSIIGRLFSRHPVKVDGDSRNFTCTSSTSNTFSVSTYSEDSQRLSVTSSSLNNVRSDPTPRISSGMYDKHNDGRMYYDIKGTAYVLPHDSLELDRISLQHFLIKELHKGKNILAPVTDTFLKGGKILDIGCSSGSWVLEVASEFPRAKVVGIDMAPVFPQNIKPRNSSFIQVNVLHGLPFDDNTFDFVHMRFMIAAFRKYEWATVLKEILRVLKPGGSLQVTEPNYQAHKAGILLSELTELVNRSLLARDIDPYTVRHLKSIVQDMGFSDVVQNFVSAPFGAWGGKIGLLEQDNVVSGIVAGKGFLMVSWGISSEEFDQRIADINKEAAITKAYFNYHTLLGKKPKSKSGEISPKESEKKK